MDNITYAIVILLAIVCVSLLFLDWRTERRLKNNLQIAAQVFGTNVKSWGWYWLGGYKQVEGNYKGRKITFRIRTKRRRGFPVRLYIEAKSVKKRFNILLDCPQPTRHTRLEPRNVIEYYSTLSLLPEFKSKGDFIEVLEEMTQAAEIVEQGADYYVEAKPRAADDWVDQPLPKSIFSDDWARDDKVDQPLLRSKTLETVIKIILIALAGFIAYLPLSLLF